MVSDWLFYNLYFDNLSHSAGKRKRKIAKKWREEMQTWAAHIENNSVSLFGKNAIHMEKFSIIFMKRHPVRYIQVYFIHTSAVYVIRISRLSCRNKTNPCGRIDRRSCDSPAGQIQKKGFRLENMASPRSEYTGPVAFFALSFPDIAAAGDYRD
jgi:hypothetical protein